VITGVVLLVRQPGRSGRTHGPPPVFRDPEQLLAERFAPGEIDEHEFSDRLAALHEQVR